ncbi:hypothetical protein QBC35DRAFT_478309 [Podospora australis]|uniref:Uncharacterized protein n=1 Tax=Podospora australis TaxID=1536484 RepID=A0AAN7AE67_9PEZI|nr:hypothetical protein QBC35DRAFT_478309 [Podospora australis]
MLLESNPLRPPAALNDLPIEILDIIFTLLVHCCSGRDRSSHTRFQFTAHKSESNIIEWEVCEACQSLVANPLPVSRALLNLARMIKAIISEASRAGLGAAASLLFSFPETLTIRNYGILADLILEHTPNLRTLPVTHGTGRFLKSTTEFPRLRRLEITKDWLPWVHSIKMEETESGKDLAMPARNIIYRAPELQTLLIRGYDPEAWASIWTALPRLRALSLTLSHGVTGPTLTSTWPGSSIIALSMYSDSARNWTT